MKYYYDPEYGKAVTEDYIKSQYKAFCEYQWFTDSYEEFREENFVELTKKPNLRQIREACRKTTEYVAMMVCVPEEELRSWEYGLSSPDMKQGLYLAMLYGVGVQDIDFSLEAQN